MSEEKWKCPKCGTENAMDDNFCGECGTKKPVIGIGMAQTVNKQETIEKEGAINESTSEKPKKKSAGKIVLILAAVCVVLIVCGVVINAQNKAKIAEQQRIEAEERARIVEEEMKAKEAEAKKAEEERKAKEAEAMKAKAAQKAKAGGGTKIGNLYWSKRSANKMNWDSAKQYCENLNEGGYTDWRLPNIDELRKTIKNCSDTQSGGFCRVSNSCLSKTCWNDCVYCRYKENNGGYYSKLGDGDEVVLWSSSTLSDLPDRAWLVVFSNGNVNFFQKLVNYYVRCVR